MPSDFVLLCLCERQETGYLEHLYPIVCIYNLNLLHNFQLISQLLIHSVFINTVIVTSRGKSIKHFAVLKEIGRKSNLLN